MAGTRAGGGAGRGAGRGAGALLGSELCAALLLLCWLCCWPDDASDTPGSRKHPRKPAAVEPGSHRRRSGDFFSRRIVSSAVSLHLPSTSGSAKTPLSAHRSHEEIPRRRPSHAGADAGADAGPGAAAGARYHSAPSVIDEVIHRRDWERSTKDLYIPLNPQNECKSIKSDVSSSPEHAPCAEPESSSIECLKPEPSRKCKKHHTNIKSSKGKKCKESNKDDIKDTDATESEMPSFYIGESVEESPMHRVVEVDFVEYERLSEERNRSIYKAKDAKQTFNESIKLKEFPQAPLRAVRGARDGDVIDEDTCDVGDGVDRSGAVHHTIESRLSFSRPYPPPSVEAVGYEGGACYLAEVGSVSTLRQRGAGAGATTGAGAGAGVGAVLVTSAGAVGAMRARHASDGDILAPLHRPESGAFSESDLDIDLEALAGEERPPAYHELQLHAEPKKETAI